MIGRVAKYMLGRARHRIYRLPVLVLMAHSRCNCRCVMCDIWKANRNGTEISSGDLAPHIEALRRLGVKQVALSGGEPLMHSNLWKLCAALKDLDVKITLLSTGLLLRRHAENIIRYCDEVIVSLDGSRNIHNAIRNVPHAFEKLTDGVSALKERNGDFYVAGRCVVQRRNYFDLLNTVTAARDMRLDQISFLPADVSTSAFNRPDLWTQERASEVALSGDEVAALDLLIEELIAAFASDIRRGFIAGDAEKLRRLPRYYAALNGDGPPPANRCNAPWVSAVIEADGVVRPCFFHRAIGHISEKPLDEILNGPEAVSFRRNLDMDRDPVCRNCVATLYRNPIREA